MNGNGRNYKPLIPLYLDRLSKQSGKAVAKNRACFRPSFSGGIDVDVAIDMQVSGWHTQIYKIKNTGCKFCREENE
jgi:hypothetical protein